MPLYHVQDSDRPMFIIAADFETALAQWRNQIRLENDGDVGEPPQGIQCVANDDYEIMVDGLLREEMISTTQPPQPVAPTPIDDVPF